MLLIGTIRQHQSPPPTRLRGLSLIMKVHTHTEIYVSIYFTCKYIDIRPILGNTQKSYISLNYVSSGKIRPLFLSTSLTKYVSESQSVSSHSVGSSVFCVSANCFVYDRLFFVIFESVIISRSEDADKHEWNICTAKQRDARTQFFI